MREIYVSVTALTLSLFHKREVHCAARRWCDVVWWVRREKTDAHASVCAT